MPWNYRLVRTADTVEIRTVYYAADGTVIAMSETPPDALSLPLDWLEGEQTPADLMREEIRKLSFALDLPVLDEIV